MYAIRFRNNPDKKWKWWDEMGLVFVTEYLALALAQLHKVAYTLPHWNWRAEVVAIPPTGQPDDAADVLAEAWGEDGGGLRINDDMLACY